MCRPFRSVLPLCLFSVALSIIAGCGEAGSTLETSAGGAMINTVCPIMGGKAKVDVSVSWNGRKVGFCCPPCIEEWAELTDDERTARLEAARNGKPGDTEHGHSHGEGEHAHAEGEHADGDVPASAEGAPAAEAPATPVPQQ